MHAGRSLRSDAHGPELRRKSGVLIRICNLKKHFPIRRGFSVRQQGVIYAVDGLSIEINRGERLGLVGESGCGKSTAGRTILQLFRRTEGSVYYEPPEHDSNGCGRSAAGATPYAVDVFKTNTLLWMRV